METLIRVLAFALLNVATPYLLRWGVKYTPSMINKQLRNPHVYNFTVGGLTAFIALMLDGFNPAMRGVIDVI